MNRSVALRSRKEGELGEVMIDEFLKKLQTEIETRKLS